MIQTTLIQIILRVGAELNDMWSFYSLKIEDRWLLAIIDLFPYVEGRTRLQKFGIFSFYEVLDNKEFFDDWRADNYGGFSPRLATSLERLEEHDYVQSSEIITEYGHPVNRYAVTEKGRDSIRDFVETHSSKLAQIKSIISHYAQQPLMVLLRDVYEQYPELTTNSKIKAAVNSSETAMYQNPEYEISQGGESNISTPLMASRHHILGDEDFREYLARSIGLKKVPDLDLQSFERIRGILSEKIDTEYFDSEELVKEVRGS